MTFITVLNLSKEAARLISNLILIAVIQYSLVLLE